MQDWKFSAAVGISVFLLIDLLLLAGSCGLSAQNDCGSILLVRLLRWFGDVIRHDDNDKVVVAVATVFIAVFTVVLAVATVRLWHVTYSVAIATRDAAIVSHQEFVAAHRPRLKIRHIHNIVTRPSQQVTATIDAANTGDTGARMAAIGLDIFPREPGAPAQFHAVPSPISLGQSVEPGQQANLDVLGRHVLSVADVANIDRGKVELCMLGIIHYRDANDTVRVTSFFRVYDPRRRRFMYAPKDDEFADWEYED